MDPDSAFDNNEIISTSATRASMYLTLGTVLSAARGVKGEETLKEDRRMGRWGVGKLRRKRVRERER